MLFGVEPYRLSAQHGADRRRPFFFRELVGKTGVAGFGAVAVHLEHPNNR